MALPTLTARQVLDATTGREVPVQQVSKVGAVLVGGSLYGDRVRAVVWSETFSGVRSRWVGSLPMRRMTVSWR